MAFVLADRVKESCSSPGTGTVTLLGAATGYQSFSAGIGANNTTYYAIADQGGANWEVGYGTIGAGGTTLARTTVLASSNSGSLVNFSSGSQDVFCDYPAIKAANLDSNNKVSFGGNSYEDFSSIVAPTYTEGRVFYDSTQKTLAYYNDVTNNLVHVGQEVQVKVINNTGSTIPIGSPVYVTSTSSGQIYPNVALAKADVQATSAVLGLTTQAITNGSIGYVATVGILQPCNTGAFAVGDVLYLSPYSAGQLMNTVPPTGYAVRVGIVAYANTPNGSIYVRQSNSYVTAAQIVGTVAVANGGTGQSSALVAGSIVYGASTTAMGVTAAGTSGQVLTSAGAGTPTWTTPTTGTVTSVTGTSPVVSSGGATPAISMAAANTSTNGYLTSTDWNTFNSKAAPFTYTSTYVPYGQGTTTPNQSSSYTFDGTTQTAPIQRASNGILVNSKTVSASYTIASTDNAVSAGPVTVASGQTVTVSSGSRWVVL